MQLRSDVILISYFLLSFWCQSLPWADMPFHFPLLYMPPSVIIFFFISLCFCFIILCPFPFCLGENLKNFINPFLSVRQETTFIFLWKRQGLWLIQTNTHKKALLNACTHTTTCAPRAHSHNPLSIHLSHPTQHFSFSTHKLPKSAMYLFKIWYVIGLDCSQLMKKVSLFSSGFSRARDQGPFSQKHSIMLGVKPVL